MAGKAYAVTRSDAEWRRILTPEQYDIMRSHGTEAPGSCALLLESDPAGFHASVAASRCSNQKGSSKAGPAGPASMIQSRVPSRHPSTEPSAWSEPRFIARTAAATWDTSLMTASADPSPLLHQRDRDEFCAVLS